MSSSGGHLGFEIVSGCTKLVLLKFEIFGLELNGYSLWTIQLSSINKNLQSTRRDESLVYVKQVHITK